MNDSEFSETFTCGAGKENVLPLHDGVNDLLLFGAESHIGAHRGVGSQQRSQKPPLIALVPH